jgi:uncharacterized protein YndB with AHSA1/START domain
MRIEPIVIKRTFPCPKRTLFEAWSKPSIMAEWFYAGDEKLKNSTVKNSFTVGADYTLVMHGPDQDHHMNGTYKAIDRYHHISFTWTSAVATDSLVTLDFKELSPNRTEMTLTHTDLPSLESREAHEGGWGRCLDNLVKILA